MSEQAGPEFGSLAIYKLTNRLIDLSKRNRLLNSPPPDPSRRGGLSTVPISQPDIFKILDLLNTRTKGILITSKSQETLPFVNGENVQTKKNIETLYSTYGEKQLHSALTNMRNRGKASIDERGVNILYVALGFVEWDDPASPGDRWRAPLILSPVTIERQNGGFAVWGTNDETFINPALIYKFFSEYKIQLPENFLDPTSDELNEIITNYSAMLENSKKLFNNYCQVVQTSVIGIFSFAKIAMFRELTTLGPEKLLENETIASLVDVNHEYGLSNGDGEEIDLDDFFEQSRPALVVEADSSQVEAVFYSQAGRNLAIQGPPGTGKSQTIVNLIADALSRNQTVLFVAEKRVALDVVQKRLKGAGLGNASLVIHPGKPQGRDSGDTVNKKAIIEEIKRTLYAAAPQAPQDIEAKYDELARVKNNLRKYVHELHWPRYGCSKSIFEIYGYLEKARSYPILKYKIADAPNLTISDLRRRQGILDEFVEFEPFITATKLETPWFNLNPQLPTAEFVEQLEGGLEELHDVELVVSHRE